MNECHRHLLGTYSRPDYVRGAPYTSPPLVPTILPGGSCDNPHFTGEETEVQRDDFAQEHKVGRPQS